MTVDVLAPYRRNGASPSLAPPPLVTPPAPPGYRAFAVATSGAKVIWLELRTGDGVTIARLASGLMEIAYDRPDYTCMLLVFAGKTVKLRGRNLRPVVDALLAGTCEYVAELANGEQPEEGAPVIDRMELLKQSGSEG
jgi:hypothetical protein